ncbi:MAG: hypothetical protein U0R76_14940 [Candidatus Nanopelagicales bacterium]
MARRPASRHALPRGRRGLQAANTALQKDLAALRMTRWSDQLEMLRLEALADSLTSHVARLSTDLADVRQELQVARTTPPARDPYIAELAAQAAELRATVATQEALLADLTARFHALIAEVHEGRAREAAQAEAARIDAERAAAAAQAAPRPRRLLRSRCPRRLRPRPCWSTSVPAVRRSPAPSPCPTSSRCSRPRCPSRPARSPRRRPRRARWRRWPTPASTTRPSAGCA